MRKVYIKLIALSLMLALSVSMVVAATYAWVVLTTNPEISGIQVTIGGGNTILVAADLTTTVDGVTYHYPDAFGETLNFGLHESYDYLNQLDGLMPVSTADGVHWFLPTYYDGTDKEVKDGKVLAGQLKDITDFVLENNLAHANLSGVTEERLAEGSYIYLDFWVVSPGTDCTLRVSVPTVDGDNSGGSFLLDLPQGSTDIGSARLKSGESHAAAMFRVGFLANSDLQLDHSMAYYVSSPNYDESYRKLRGYYANPGENQKNSESNHFTIYEPNGDYHPGIPDKNGLYLVTNPIGLVDEAVQEVSILNRVTVQRRSDWIILDNGQTMLEQIFQTASIGKNTMEDGELTEYFYNTYLQGQVEHFVNKGTFVKRSEYLANQLDLSQVPPAGATDDVYIIRLERDVPQRIRMFVWLEGQDADCANVTQKSSLVLNLEFAGSTANEMAGEK